MLAPTANAHSAAIYVTLKDQPGLIEQPHARVIARTWFARLNEFHRHTHRRYARRSSHQHLISRLLALAGLKKKPAEAVFFAQSLRSS